MAQIYPILETECRLKSYQRDFFVALIISFLDSRVPDIDVDHEDDDFWDILDEDDQSETSDDHDDFD